MANTNSMILSAMAIFAMTSVTLTTLKYKREDSDLNATSVTARSVSPKFNISTDDFRVLKIDNDTLEIESLNQNLSGSNISLLINNVSKLNESDIEFIEILVNDKKDFDLLAKREKVKEVKR